MLPVCALIITALCGCGKKETVAKEYVRPVKMMTLGTGDDTGYRSYPGKVQAAQRVKLAFQVAGPLIELNVKPGDEVKKGKVIARIDPRDFQQKLNSETAQYNTAKADYKRYTGLLEKKAVSKADYERKKRDYEVAEANMETAKKALDDTYMRAPFDGVVANKLVENFQNVQAKQEILHLKDINRIEIVVDIPESDMATVKKTGDRNKAEALLAPKVEFPSLPEKIFPMQIKEFEAEADSVTQTFAVTFIMDNPKEYNILPGMSASVKLNESFFSNSSAAQGKVFMIPVDAVLEVAEGKPCVWKVDTKTLTVSKQEVTVGAIDGGKIQITSGVEPGETICTAGVHYLKDGQKVKKLTVIGTKKLDGR